MKLDAVIAASTPTFTMVTAACAALLLLTALFDRLRRQSNAAEHTGAVAAKVPRSKRSAIAEMNGRLDQALAALQSQQQTIDELAATVRSLESQQQGRFSSLEQQLREVHAHHQQTLDAVQSHQKREYGRLQRIRNTIETHQQGLQTLEIALGHLGDTRSAAEPSFGNGVIP